MLSITATPPRQLNQAFFQIANLKEVLIEHRQLSRIGQLDDEGLSALAQQAKDQNLEAVLVWDLLCSDTDLINGAALLRRIDLSLFSSIRVQDAGVANYVREHFPQLKLQFILETGNHNQVGLETWVKGLEPDRIVLSNELPINTIAHLRQVLNVKVEISVLGRLLIFYTPRPLLEALADEETDHQHREHLLVSEARKGFPVIVNNRGSFMYYEKDLFLLPYLDEIRDAGVDFIRMDFKFFDGEPLCSHVVDFLSGKEAESELVRACLGKKVTRGFFKSNRTDKQFKRLKNPNLIPDDNETLLARVMETKKKKYLALETYKSLKVGDTLRILIPEGTWVEGRVEWIRDACGEKVSEAKEPGLWLVNTIRKASSGSLVYQGN